MLREAIVCVCVDVDVFDGILSRHIKYTSCGSQERFETNNAGVRPSEFDD